MTGIPCAAWFEFDLLWICWRPRLPSLHSFTFSKTPCGIPRDSLLCMLSLTATTRNKQIDHTRSSFNFKTNLLTIATSIWIQPNSTRRCKSNDIQPDDHNDADVVLLFATCGVAVALANVVPFSSFPSCWDWCPLSCGASRYRMGGPSPSRLQPAAALLRCWSNPNWIAWNYIARRTNWPKRWGSKMKNDDNIICGKEKHLKKK